MKKRLQILCVIYFLILVIFSIYWATNFSKYIHYKGDEFFVFAEILLGLTITFYLTIQFTIKRINFLLALTLPFFICVISFIIGVLIILLTEAGDLPRQYILIYGGLYLIFSMLSIYKFWGQTIRNQPN